MSYVSHRAIIRSSTFACLAFALALAQSAFGPGHARADVGKNEVSIESIEVLSPGAGDGPDGFTPPIGSNKGSIVGSAGGRKWAAVPAADGLRLYDLGEIDAPRPVAPRHVATLPAVEAFRPDRAPAGIIAVLIGLRGGPAPAIVPGIVLHSGRGELLLYALAPGGGDPGMGAQIPGGGDPGILLGPIQGLMEDEGIYYF
jgi:hypothetical protein